MCRLQFSKTIGSIAGSRNNWAAIRQRRPRTARSKMCVPSSSTSSCFGQASPRPMFPSHGAFRLCWRHFSEGGRITCYTQAVNISCQQQGQGAGQGARTTRRRRRAPLLRCALGRGAGGPPASPRAERRSRAGVEDRRPCGPLLHLVHDGTMRESSRGPLCAKRPCPFCWPLLCC